MPSKTEICNLALSHLGKGKEISNIETDRSAEASACRRFYDVANDATLRNYNWPRTAKIATLALVESEPNNEWAYAYRYPTDCLRIRRVLTGTGVRSVSRDTRVPYAEGQDDQGGLIYCDLTDAQIEYTARAASPAFYPPDLALAVSLRLAAYIAPRVTGGDPFKVGERALRLYGLEVGMALTTAFSEEQQDSPPDSEFITVRDS